MPNSTCQQDTRYDEPDEHPSLYSQSLEGDKSASAAAAAATAASTTTTTDVLDADGVAIHFQQSQRSLEGASGSSSAKGRELFQSKEWRARMESRKSMHPSAAALLTKLPSDRSLQKQAWLAAAGKKIEKAKLWKPKLESQGFRNVGPSNCISDFSPELAMSAPIESITMGIGSQHFQKNLTTDVIIQVTSLVVVVN